MGVWGGRGVCAGIGVCFGIGVCPVVDPERFAGVGAVSGLASFAEDSLDGGVLAGPEELVPDASRVDAEGGFAGEDFFGVAAGERFAAALSGDASVEDGSDVPAGASNGSSGDSPAGGLTARAVVFLAGRRARFLPGWSEEVESAGVGGWFSSLTKVLLRTGRGSGRWFHSWVTGFAA
jgi:hypothetical protein